MTRINKHIFEGALLSSPTRYKKIKKGGNKELINTLEKAHYNNDVLLSKEYISKHKTTTKSNKVMAKSLNSFDSVISNYMDSNKVRASFVLGLDALRAALSKEDSDILSPAQISRAVWGFAVWASDRHEYYNLEGDVCARAPRVYLTPTTSEKDAVVVRTSVAGGKTYLAVLTSEYTQQRISSLWSSFLNVAKQDTKRYSWASAFCERKKAEKHINNVRASVASASEDTLLAALAAKKGVTVEALKALLG
jgi:hypothetical protein